MRVDLSTWRKRRHLTQVDAATLLGVSQPYLSLLEKGARPLTADLRQRMKLGRPGAVTATEVFPSALSALGYAGFAHVRPARRRLAPTQFLLNVLSLPDVDARVVDALPWVVRKYAHQIDLPWLVTHAKLRNLQNRLGFVLQTADARTAEIQAALAELQPARLLSESTLCWDSMPVATRDWLRQHRSHIATFWNILSRLDLERDCYEG